MPFGLLALLTASAFAGAAFYVNAVAQPARLTLDDAALLSEWKPSYRRATVMQVALVLLATMCGLAAWWRLGGVGWLAGAGLMLANIPVTFGLILPVNRRLMATEPASADHKTRALIRRWGGLHAIRTGLGVAAALSFVAAALASGQ